MELITRDGQARDFRITLSIFCLFVFTRSDIPRINQQLPLSHPNTVPQTKAINLQTLGLEGL